MNIDTFIKNKYCQKCKLHEKAQNPYLIGAGNKNTDILFISDMPTQVECEKRIPFYSNHFDALVKRLNVAGMASDRNNALSKYYFAYAVKCPIFTQKKETTKTQRANCRPFTLKLIEEIKPKVIVSLGTVPLQQLINISLNIKVIHGKTFYFPEFDTYIVPTFQPKVLLYEKDQLIPKQVKEDLLVVKKLAMQPKKRIPKPNLKVLTDPYDIKEYLISLLSAKSVSIDIETTGLNPFKDDITFVSFSSKLYEGVGVYWKDLIKFYDELKTFFKSDVPKTFHNAAFDREFFYCAGFDINNVTMDTMLGYHTLNMSYEGGEANGLFKLKTMTWFLTEYGGYEDVLTSYGGIAGVQKKEEPSKEESTKNTNKKTRKKTVTRETLIIEDLNKKIEAYEENFKNKKLNIIRSRGFNPEDKESSFEYYSTMDPMVTHLISNKLKVGLDKQFSFIFNNLIMPLNYVLMKMKNNGLKLDKAYMCRIKEENNLEVEKIKKEFYSAVGEEVNLNSTKDLRELLFNKMKITPDKRFISGKTKQPSTDVTALNFYSKQHPILKKILEYRGLEKQTKTYIDGFMKYMDEYDRVHPSFMQHSTATGRLSCIAEGTTISLVGENKNIEDVQVGDLVYCYDDEGDLQISKVKNVIDNGVRACSIIKWQSSGSKDIGTLIATPDHLIKHKYKGWVKVEDLKRYDKVFHLRKRSHKDRIRLYGTNSFMDLEERAIKVKYFKALSELHIHHKDGNKNNNLIENLEILKGSDHTKLHVKELIEKGKIKWNHLKHYRPTPKYGIDHPLWKEFSKNELVQMIHDVKGVITKVPMDFNTFKRKCILHNIDIESISKMYSRKGILLTEDTIANAIYKFSDRKNPLGAASKELGVGYYKLKKLCENYNISYNHTITSVKTYGKCRVYDLEIEDYHNFIANEICVHNCSNPNVQNIPRDNRIRGMVIPDNGCKIISADLSQAELRLLAQFSNDVKMIEAFKSGKDIHAMTACNALLNIPVEQFDKKLPEHNEARSISKCVHPYSIVNINGVFKRIGDIDNNYKEDTFNKVSDSFIWNGKENVKINSFYKSKKDERILIVSKRSVLVCSKNHQIKMEDGSLKKAFDITKGDELVQQSFIKPNNNDQYINYNPFDESNHENGFPVNLNENWAYIAGAFTGDGCYNSKSIGVSTGTGEKYSIWQKSLEQSFSKVGINVSIRNYKNDSKVYVGSTKLRRFFDILGLTTLSEGKTFKIPEWVLNNEKNAWAFLGGLLDTNGTFSTNPSIRNISVTTKSWVLAQDFSILLGILDIDYSVEVTYNKKYKRNYYRIHILSKSLELVYENTPIRCFWKKEKLYHKISTRSFRKTPAIKKNEVIYIEKLDIGDLVDYEVNTSDHLYWVNGLITHNTINFGIIYGMQGYTLANRLGFPMLTEEDKKESISKADYYIDKWFKLYSGAKEWLDNIQETARHKKEVWSLHGRRRLLPFAESSDEWKQGEALRQSMNTPIQATASDITNFGLIKMQTFLDSHPEFKTKIVAVIHDDILLESPEEEVEVMKNKLVQCMVEDVPMVTIPLVADPIVLDRWMKD